MPADSRSSACTCASAAPCARWRLIERTTAVVRRHDDTLKVYHADVRATGRENAEIPLALMERSHMTAVIVGPMQPHAIDAMLNTLHEAASQPTWRCPTVLFMLPPGAVWIANKIAGSRGRHAVHVQHAQRIVE